MSRVTGIDVRLSTLRSYIRCRREVDCLPVRYFMARDPQGRPLLRVTELYVGFANSAYVFKREGYW
jgi:hypothetical protein